MKIKLMDWASRLMSPAPCRNTVLKWRAQGRISPAPKWEGRGYFVEENAKLLDDKPPKREARTANQPKTKQRLVARL